MNRTYSPGQSHENITPRAPSAQREQERKTRAAFGTSRQNETASHPVEHYNIPPTGIQGQRRSIGHLLQEIADLRTAHEQEISCLQGELSLANQAMIAALGVAQQMTAAFHQAREELQRVKQGLLWEEELFANPALDPGHKLVLWSERKAVQRGRLPDSKGRVQVYNPEIAERIGMPVKTLQRKNCELEAAGIIDAQTHKDPKKRAADGQLITRRHMSFSREVWEQPKALTLPNAPKRGGYHPQCANCSSSNTIVRKRQIIEIHCQDCGHVSMDEGPETITFPPEGQEQVCIEAPAQAGSGKSQNEALFKQELPIAPHFEISLLPAVAAEEIPVSQVDSRPDDEVLRSAAALLQWSPCGTHIFMPPDGETKYREPTPKHDITQAEAIAHFRGGTPRGFKQQKNAGLVRMLVFDEDSAAGLEMQRSAAAKLDAASHLPMLEKSPSTEHPDGAHLILLYDGLVDARSAYAEACRIAPELRTCKEVWPFTKNMRAPGAFYKRPGVAGWCTLFSWHTGQESHDGISAARLLLANMTPAKLVPELPPEPPTPAPEKPKAPAKPAPALRSALPARPVPNGLPDPQFGLDAIAWWNRTHTLDDILPRATKTHALAVWRGEKEPSVLYNDTGPYAGKAKDFGDNGRMMDSFELWLKVQGYEKGEGMSMICSLYRQHLQGHDQRN